MNASKFVTGYFWLSLSPAARPRREPARVASGFFEHCLKVQETTALEPDTIVHDFYAPGIGPVLSIEMPSNERLELVRITTEP